MKKQRLLKTMILALALLGGVSSAWAGDFIDDASEITVKQNNNEVTPTIETVGGKKVLKFTTLNSSDGTKDAMIEFTFSGKDVTPGQVFGVIEYTTNVKTGNNNRFRNLTLDNNALEEGNAANTLAFEPDGKKIIICPFLQNENSTDSKKMKTFYMNNVDAEKMTLTYAKVYAIMNAASTETVITGIGVYTLGEILEKYPSLKTNNWKLNQNCRLYNEETAIAYGSNVPKSKTNNGIDNGVIETKGGSTDLISTLANAKLFCKAIDFSKIPTNYQYIWLRYLQPTDKATQEDLFVGLHDDAILMPNFTGVHSLVYLPTMHKKIIDFDRKMQNTTFVDGIAPSNAVTVDGKTLGQNTTANYATYSRKLKAGYNSCAMPFKKFANTADIPAGLTFYKVVSLTDGKVVYSKLSNSDLTSSTVFTDGTNWTPIIIHAEAEGVYTFVGRDAITNWSGITYSAKTVGNSGGELFWVGSFVNEVPTAPYDATTNYGITSDGTRFAPMVAGTTKTTYYRAFLADSRSASARELMPLFTDNETTGIANLNVNVNDNFDANAPIYNLAGQRIGKDYKGVVIQNGKKFIQK
jgi:hypothetical protein